MVFQGERRLNMNPSDSATDKAQLTEQPDVTKVDILSSVRIASSTKDSVHVKWDIWQDFVSSIQGFQVRYQAEGSHVVQFSPRLSPNEFDYDINKLHEDTCYQVCVKVYTNITSAHASEPCVQASTRTDSLHVALGSSFGAFLALGIIIGFVFLAKWRHNGKRRKRLKKLMAQNGDVSYSRDMHDVDYAISDVSMQVNDEQMKLSELGSQLDDCDGRDFTAGAAALPELSECSEEPHSNHSNSFFGGSYERCCQCEVDLSAESFLNRSSPRSMRSARNLRQQSVESSRSLGIPRQQSIGSYGTKRASLRKQRSVDSPSRRNLVSHRSRDSGLYSFPRQKSQDSDFSDCSPSFDKRSHRCKPRDNGLRPGGVNISSNISRSRSPLDGYRSDRSFEASPSPIAQIFQVTSPNTPPQNTNSNPFQNPDGRPADVRPKYLSTYIDMEQTQQPHVGSKETPRIVTPQLFGLPVTETKLLPIPVSDFDDDNSLDSGVVASPPENKLEFDSHIPKSNSVHKTDAPLNDKSDFPEGNCIQNSPQRNIQNTPQSNTCRNDVYVNNVHDSLKQNGVVPLLGEANEGIGNGSSEKDNLADSSKCFHGNLSPSKEPLVPESYPLVSNADFSCVNDGGHSNGLRPNNSCPNW